MAAKSEIMVLKEFFGLLPGTTLKDFAAECGRLDAAEKRWLAVEAAKQLGLTQADVNFALVTLSAS